MISLILGLGNVGPQYAGTRHNLGFEVVHRVAGVHRAARPIGRGSFEWTRIPAESEASESEATVLAWPTTLVNQSGPAAVDLLEEFGLSRRQMLVVVDDCNLPLGALRFRAEGSDGGHNGLASIIEFLETEDFPRLRLGIGRPADKNDTSAFVLSRFSEKEAETVERMVATAAEAVIFATSHRLEEAMSEYNSSPALPEET